jgi:hypothetical protein
MATDKVCDPESYSIFKSFGASAQEIDGTKKPTKKSREITLVEKDVLLIISLLKSKSNFYDDRNIFSDEKTIKNILLKSRFPSGNINSIKKEVLMSAVLLARLQFAFTICFHFLFPAMTLGTTLVILISESLYLAKQNGTYRRITDFLVKLLGLIFVVGAASGIVMEFSFGTNWSEYSRAVGDIFGPLLAAEGIIAFFLESVFLGVLIFARNRVSPRFYWLSTLLVFTGGHLSAFWIIVANSWMQTPAGYLINDTGRIVLEDFSAAVFNPSTMIRSLHTIIASWITG